MLLPQQISLTESRQLKADSRKPFLMLKNIKILLKADLRGWLNGIKHGGEAWRKTALKCIGYLVFVVALSVLGNSLFTHLRLTEAQPALVLGVINGFIVFGIIRCCKRN